MSSDAAWRIKRLDVLNIDPMLERIAEWMRAKFPVLDVVTSAHRIYKPGEKLSVHNLLPSRGLDIRCWDASFGRRVADTINAEWEYDPARPNMKVAIYHDVGQGPHLHLQVHPNTRRRDDGGRTNEHPSG